MNKKYVVRLETFKNNTYDEIRHEHEIFSSSNYDQASRYYNKEKTKLHNLEGLSLNVEYYDDKGEWQETEHLGSFDYLDLEELKEYELHIFESMEHEYLTVEKCKEEIKNKRFYRDDAEELSFENNFSLNQYSNYDDECMVIVKRLNNNDFKVIEVLKV